MPSGRILYGNAYFTRDEVAADRVPDWTGTSRSAPLHPWSGVVYRVGLARLLQGIVDGSAQKLWVLCPLNKMCESADDVGVKPVGHDYCATGTSLASWKGDA